VCRKGQQTGGAREVYIDIIYISSLFFVFYIYLDWDYVHSGAGAAVWTCGNRFKKSLGGDGGRRRFQFISLDARGMILI
jgi:hypothetical protein